MTTLDDRPAVFDVSVVIPVFNEAPNLGPLIAELTSQLQAIAMSYEIIIADDGSTDDTLDTGRALAATVPHLRLLSLRAHSGKAAALAVAFAHVRGERVVTLDGDLQDDPAELPRLLSKLDDGYDLVNGWKHPRPDPARKLLASRIFNIVVRCVSGLGLHDVNCGMKAYRRDVLVDLPLYGELHRYIPLLVHWRGFRVGEVQVSARPRRFGKSKYGAARLLKGALDLLTVLLLNRFRSRPLHIFGGLGSAFVAVGAVILGYLSVRWLQGETIGGRPLLMLGVLLSIVGTQWIAVGVFAELLTSIMHRGAAEYALREDTGAPLRNRSDGAERSIA